MKRVKTENVKPSTSKRAKKDEQTSSNGLADEKVDFKPSWAIEEELAKTCQVPENVAASFTKLLNNDCTLPFIARYRKEAVGNLEIEQLRKMKMCYEELGQVQHKISMVLDKLNKQNLLTRDLNETISNARDLEEVELHYAPLKESKKRTLVARAKELGLDDTAMEFLSNTAKLSSLNKLVQKGKPGLETIEEVELGIQHILADFIAKDKENYEQIESLISAAPTQVKVTKSRSASKQEDKDIDKFKFYFDKSFNTAAIKPHVFLAISRGESLKILSAKIVFPLNVSTRWSDFCKTKYGSSSRKSDVRERVLTAAIQDAYDRILEPSFCRRIRAKLKAVAHQASIDSFSRNLKCLLLTPPLRNTVVLGLDPGFKHGCKCAAVAADGSVLHTETVHIQFGSRNHNQPAASALRRIISEYQCLKVAIGNGTACRETEGFVSELITRGAFKPLDVQYTIINEAGASIYSCSEEARHEFPDMDPNLISAVSIGRRLQDPLTEYVRVSPQNLGIGMYQHDVPVKKLTEALDDVVSECVSFVGVDVNVCPLHVLSKVAGLTANKAKKIIEHRNKNGPFINRQQLMEVASIGAKTFEQCAGFLTIRRDAASCWTSGALVKEQAQARIKTTARAKKAERFQREPLDETCVHPESYALANRIIKMFGGDTQQLGEDAFIRKLNAFSSVEKMARELNESEADVAQIVASLSQPLHFDFRDQFDRPLFKRTVSTLSDLRADQQLTGRVTNVTDFGAFVDIGVGKDGLIHSSALQGNEVHVGMHVTVRILSVDHNSQRIALGLVV